MSYYHINIEGASFTYTTTDIGIAAHHQVHGAAVWISDCMSPDKGNPRSIDVRHAFNRGSGMLCNYCGFGSPCKH